MRLITDAQHAQIVEAFNKVIATGLDQRTHNEFTFVSGHYLHEALATLQALPEVEVVGYVYGVMTDGCTRRSMATIQADIELKSGAPLYATKEPS